MTLAYFMAFIYILKYLKGFLTLLSIFPLLNWHYNPNNKHHNVNGDTPSWDQAVQTFQVYGKFKV